MNEFVTFALFHEGPILVLALVLFVSVRYLIEHPRRTR